MDNRFLIDIIDSKSTVSIKGDIKMIITHVVILFQESPDLKLLLQKCIEADNLFNEKKNK